MLVLFSRFGYNEINIYMHTYIHTYIISWLSSVDADYDLHSDYSCCCYEMSSVR